MNTSQLLKRRQQKFYLNLQLSLPLLVIDSNISLPEPPMPTTIYVDEVAPFIQEDWDKVVNRLKQVPSHPWVSKVKQ